MGLSEEAYLSQLQDLLPHGPAWPREATQSLTRLYAGWAHALAVATHRAESLIDEADPSTTDDLLVDWERAAGLPDRCEHTPTHDVAIEQSTDQRREALLGRLAGLGAQTPAYFIAVARALGYEILEIKQYEVHHVERTVESALSGNEWGHTWAIDTPNGKNVDLTVDDSVDEAISWGGNALLECVLQRLKPAHTALIINYI